MALENLTRLARAVEDNWCAAWETLGSVNAIPPTLVDSTSTYVRVYTPGIPEMLLNIIQRYESPRTVERADVEAVIAPFRQHRLPFQWWLTLGTEPAGLREQLRYIGMQTWGGATSMALSLTGWEPAYKQLTPGIELGHVTSPQEAQAALRVICDVFYVPAAPMARWTIENPAFDVYTAHWAGRTVAALAILRKDTVAGVYHVATIPSARRRGIAGNLLLLALHDARATGCTQATLTATPDALHLYEQLGFRTVGTIEQWVPGPELSRALAQGKNLPTHPSRGGFWE